MKLKEYVTTKETAASLAKRLDVPNVSISNWANGRRPIPVEWMPLIEKATNGHVSRKDMLPEKWHIQWPELAQKQESESIRTE